MHLVDIDAELAQIRLGQLDLGHELLVGLGHVVESHDVPTQTKEQVGAEGNEGPEGKLMQGGGEARSASGLDRMHHRMWTGQTGAGTYHGDDLGLDKFGQGEELEVEGEVELDGHAVVSMGVCRRMCRLWMPFRLHTDEARRAREMVCCARVMLKSWSPPFRSNASLCEV